jgi:hypothetical protein
LCSNGTLSDIRDLSAYYKGNNNLTTEVTNNSKKAAIVEATGFLGHQNEEIELVASQPKPFVAEQTHKCSQIAE